jgi:hypothetical protein
MKTALKSLLCALPLMLGAAAAVQADDHEGMYAVTITNLTRGITFTPILVASHKPGKPLFTLGEKAKPELVAVAESGNTQPFADLLTSSGMAYDTASSGALLPPGQSVTVKVKTKGRFNHISLVGMLIPTNDGFIALNGVRGPKFRRSVTLMSPAYDAGSETNDELCAHIPGPYCMGEALSPLDEGEGYVHIHAGIHGGGDLLPATFDWRNPTAKITITRMH